MASKRAVRRSIQRRQCGVKTSYTTRDRAIVAARAATRDFQGEQMRAYACQWCQGWHIGHTRRGRIERLINALAGV